MSGRVVRTLVSGRLTAGELRIAWDGRNTRGTSVAPGVYWVRVRNAAGTETNKLVKVD